MFRSIAFFSSSRSRASFCCSLFFSCSVISFLSSESSHRFLLGKFATLFSALFLGAMTWMLFAKVLRARGSFEITSVLHWPIWPFIAAAAAGIAAAFLFAVLRLAKIARGGTGEIHD